MAAKTTKTTTPSGADTSLEARQPATGRFVRLAPVTVPTLKLEDGAKIYVKITNAIQTKIKKDEMEVDPVTGQTKAKEIHVAPVVDLTTGELAQVVVGAALKSELEDYKGGNKAYVGLCFEIAKYPAKPGKRAKQYVIFEVSAPGEGAV